jgi:hypothetical protein
MQKRQFMSIADQQFHGTAQARCREQQEGLAAVRTTYITKKGKGPWRL